MQSVTWPACDHCSVQRYQYIQKVTDASSIWDWYSVVAAYVVITVANFDTIMHFYWRSTDTICEVQTTFLVHSCMLLRWVHPLSMWCKWSMLCVCRGVGGLLWKCDKALKYCYLQYITWHHEGLPSGACTYVCTYIGCSTKWLFFKQILERYSLSYHTLFTHWPVSIRAWLCTLPQ